MNAGIDQNSRATLTALSSTGDGSIVTLYANPTTHRLLVDLAGGSGTVTTVSVVSANGFAGTVATATSTPAITLTTTITGLLKGNGTAISAATAGTDYSAGTSALATGILKSTTSTGALSIAVAGTDYLTPTGSAAGLTSFPTLNQNTTGSAATLTTTRTIWGQNFNGSANVTGDLALGVSNLTLTGSVGATGARATKVWATDIESTNAPTVGGVAVPTISSTNTLTNKRITTRTGTTTSSATPTINTDNVDFYSLTAQAVDITSFTTNLTGTPTENQLLWIAITGTGARAITWGASFEASTVALPTTTVSTNRLDVGFTWNTVTSKWKCVAVA